MSKESTIEKDHTVTNVKKTDTHPVGTSVGTAGGAVAGMAVGASVAGPPGAVVGAAVGAVVGGLTGQGLAAAIDPKVEDTYWRENYNSRPYIAKDRSYDDYRDAYKYGWESRAARTNSRWEDVETDLARGWDKAKANSRLGWAEAKSATRDAWHRVERAIPGDADHDGR